MKTKKWTDSILHLLDMAGLKQALRGPLGLTKTFILIFPLICFAGCSEGDIEGGGDSPEPPDEDTQRPGGGEDSVSVDIKEDVMMSLDTVSGFQAHFKYLTKDGELENYIEKVPYGCLGRQRVYISKLPFTGKEAVEGSLQVKEAFFDKITLRSVYGLAPNERYYVRYCFPMAKDGNSTDSTYVFSNQLAFDTTDESWFESVECYANSIKDAVVSIRLNWASEPMIKGDTLMGGYDMERSDAQLKATYVKISPAYETYPDEDTNPDHTEYLPTGTRIELHHLQPGEKVKLTPWVKIGDKKMYGETVTFSSCELKTEGYVQLGGCLWAACDLGAENPYTPGKEYTKPEELETATEKLPGESAWTMLMRKTWVCGTLEGAKGWFVIDRQNAIFMPFSYNNGYSNSVTYWGAEVFHPSDWGVASYARRIFMATDGEGLKHQQFYGKDYYAPVSNSEHVRLVKYL